MNIVPASLARGGIFYPARIYDDLYFAAGMGRVIIIGILRARDIWVEEKTQLYTFDHIECQSLHSDCSVNLHSIEASGFIEVQGRLGTFSCKAPRIFAGQAITAAKNVEAVYNISTPASINVGGHIICTKGSISAGDGINCGNTITAGGEIFTRNAICAGACSWRRDKNNDTIKAKSLDVGQVVGHVIT